MIGGQIRLAISVVALSILFFEGQAIPQMVMTSLGDLLTSTSSVNYRMVYCLVATEGPEVCLVISAVGIDGYRRHGRQRMIDPNIQAEIDCPSPETENSAC